MWMQVAVAAASARWHSITNSTHRSSPARAFAKTSSGSRSRNRSRIDRYPRIPSRCPCPPHPQNFSFGSVLTTECPPSHTPLLHGYRPNPTPFPSVHTRVSLFSTPREAAIPAAVASASLKILTGTLPRLSDNPASSAACRLNPFICCKLGDSSTIPSLVSPGNPTPIAEIPPFSPSGFNRPQICSASASAGRESSASGESPLSGYALTLPATLPPSTSAAAMCSITSAPAVRFFPLIFCSRRSQFRQLIQPIERRRLVAFRQRRIVEYRVHEILHRSLQREHRLPDVQQFRRPFSNDVHTQQLFRLRLEDQLQSSRRISANLPARNLPEIRNPDFVRHSRIRQLLFRLPNKRNLRNGVNPVGIICRVRMNRHPKRFRRRNPPLLHGYRTQARESDHVPHSIDVRLFRPVVRIHGDAPARIGFQSCRRQIQFIQVSLPAHRVEQRLSPDLFLALQICHHAVVRCFFHAFHFFVQPQRHPPVPQVITQGFHHLRIREFQ